MPQIEGLYVVEFGDVAIGGQTYYCNGGVVVLETNHIFGGDSGYYYLGNYTIITGSAEVTGDQMVAAMDAVGVDQAALRAVSGAALSGRNPSRFSVAGRSAHRIQGASKAVVCRTFGPKRSTLINSLAWIG